MQKIIVVLHKKPEMSRDEFRRYWRDVHVPLGAAMPGVRKYIQNLAGDGAPFDGIAEMWFDDDAAMAAAFTSPEAAAAAVDAQQFLEKSEVVLVEEVAVVDEMSG